MNCAVFINPDYRIALVLLHRQLNLRRILKVDLKFNILIGDRRPQELLAILLLILKDQSHKMCSLVKLPREEAGAEITVRSSANSFAP
jgi:hypothetical protein